MSEKALQRIVNKELKKINVDFYKILNNIEKEKTPKLVKKLLTLSLKGF